MMSTQQRRPPTVFRFTVQQKTVQDPRSRSFLKDAHASGLDSIEKITCQDLYFVRGTLEPAELDLLAKQLLHDPVTQTIRWEAPAPNAVDHTAGPEGYIIEVTLRPGVTDPVAEQIRRAARLLGVTSLEAASTGQRFIVTGEGLTEGDLARLATRLLCNPIIQRYATGEIVPAFPESAESTGKVETLALRGLTEAGLIEFSQARLSALDLNEMKAIQAYCESESREPSDVEFEMIAQTWSEHCVHKTFKAYIEIAGPVEETIDNLFDHTIRQATRQIGASWVRSAFVDNAGIIDYDGVHEFSFKVETHNHPSAVEPFGGANTGTGGVIRDIIGVSARPVAATDVLCFGPADLSFDVLPAGVLHPRRIASGVVAGIQDYGNKIGIPTVSGAILYDPGYTANPLVFCGCAGIAPINAHPRDALPGDRIIVIGGRTGRDGLRGATFSSMAMNAQTGEVSGASVQIGAPITEKGLIDVTLIARDRGLYHAITDCGAGGLSSAVGEMASKLGCLVQLDRVRLKYPGLAPWEIWVSEAQERMVLAVPAITLDALSELCDTYEVELTDIGEFTGSGRTVICYGERTVLNLDNAFLHEGIPQRRLKAVLPKPAHKAGSRGIIMVPVGFSYNDTLLGLLSHPNIASKEPVIRVYDHEVQGGTVVKPLVGLANDGPSDACLIRPGETAGSQAIALSAGINPEYGKLDPGQMAVNVIDEAIRNAVAIGADPQAIALLDNFCWGNSSDPQTLGELVAAANACRDAAIAYGAPFVSGKDSFNNEYRGSDGRQHAIPPTLLISAASVMQDWSKAVTMDLKAPGDRLFLIGPFDPTLGGSHFSLASGIQIADGVPACDAEHSLANYRALHAAIDERLVKACHDLSEGGLAVAAAEMCIGGRLGMNLRLPWGESVRACFGETTGCLLVEVTETDVPAFETHFEGLDSRPVGRVLAEPTLKIHGGQAEIEVTIEELLRAWKAELN